MDVGVPVVTVFLQGLLSFFSPCVLPLVPLYLGYLSGGAEQGELYGKRGRLFVNTICFVIGISSAFFMMGLGVSAANGIEDRRDSGDFIRFVPAWDFWKIKASGYRAPFLVKARQVEDVTGCGACVWIYL